MDKLIDPKELLRLARDIDFLDPRQEWNQKAPANRLAKQKREYDQAIEQIRKLVEKGSDG